MPAKHPIPGDLLARTQTITGLRNLADYLEDHPDLPIPEYGGDLTLYTHGTDEQQRAELDRIAHILNVTPIDNTGRDGHYTASKTFGRITYRAVYIPSRAWARHHAQDSYRTNITPDHHQDHDGHKGVAA